MTSLDEYLRMLGALSDADKRAVVEATKNDKWIPNPGPQTDAYFSEADLLFYGGAGGGGKSSLISGLALTQHQRTLILRVQYTDLDAIIDEVCKVAGTRQGLNLSAPPKFRSSDGRLVDFGAAASLDRAKTWQGNPHDLICVQRGTRVVMADGSLRPIEDIRVGDMVETLEGGRRVTRTFPAMRKPAARVRAFDRLGREAARQVQSRSHELLTPSGWVSHDTFAASGRAGSSEPIGCPSSRTGAGLSGRSSVLLCGSPREKGSHPQRIETRWRVPPQSEHASELATSVFGARLNRDNAFSGSCASFQPTQRHRGSTWFQALLRPAAECFSGGDSALRSSAECAGYDVPASSSLGYSKDGCWSGLHQCDAPLLVSPGRLQSPAGGQQYPQQRGDVAPPIPTYSEADGLDKTPKYTCHKEPYDHPYTMETRYTSAALCAFSCEWDSIGVVDLFDIEVEEVNHYITEGGFINKNCFDEACQFPEAVVRFLLGWNRAADESLDKRSRQRVRSILASNPPLAAEGEWVIGMFRPWLDVTHSNPAKPGELRWFVTDPDGHDLEVDGPDDVRVWNGQTYTPASRTFIPAALNDNPFLIETGYQTTLDAMPEPMRSAIRDGNFLAAREDDPWQVIPTHWVLAAFERWREGKPKNSAMTAVGLDVARGGRDATVLAPRYGLWVDELISVPGRETPDGPSVVAQVAKHLRDSAIIAVDAIGVGGAVEDALKNAGLTYELINGSSTSSRATRDGNFHFATKRSELIWSLREALDPEYGIGLALPPDVALQADLTAPRFTVRPGDPPKIYVESKIDIIKRLGRSPDRGDAVVYAYAAGEIEKRRDRRERVKNAPTRVNSGYSVRNWR